MLIQSVFPERTAPSHIIPFLSAAGLPWHHHVRTASCFGEKG
nr:MAG TPA: peptide amidase [Caudoviricetes sp.]